MYGFEEYTYHIFEIVRNQLKRGDDGRSPRGNNLNQLYVLNDATQSVLTFANGVMELWSSLLRCGCRGRIVVLVGSAFVRFVDTID